MEKRQVLDQLISKAKKDFEAAKKTYEVTQTMVQKGDLKSDGKYDTRATEANYLASGQRQRITDLEQEINLLEEIPSSKLSDNDEVRIGALVDIELNGNIRKYFISPTAGGTILNISGVAVMVISVFSPIGREVLDLKVNDSFEVDINGETREYLIKNIQ